MPRISRLIQVEDGTTAVEYACLLGLIIAVGLSAISVFGGVGKNLFQQSAESLPIIQP